VVSAGKRGKDTTWKTWGEMGGYIKMYIQEMGWEAWSGLMWPRIWTNGGLF
jgi:hypothetical protein